MLRFNIVNWGLVGVGLGWAYKIYRNERLGLYPSKLREFLEVMKVIAIISLGQYLNLFNMQYNTDLFIKRYGHITQDRINGSDMSDE